MTPEEIKTLALCIIPVIAFYFMLKYLGAKWALQDALESKARIRKDREEYLADAKEANKQLYAAREAHADAINKLVEKHDAELAKAKSYSTWLQNQIRHHPDKVGKLSKEMISHGKLMQKGADRRERDEAKAQRAAVHDDAVSIADRMAEEQKARTQKCSAGEKAQMNRLERCGCARCRKKLKKMKVRLGWIQDDF